MFISEDGDIGKVMDVVDWFNIDLKKNEPQTGCIYEI